jgi:isoleucyl-tRNA synthetase
LAREVVRRVNAMRRDADYALNDNIRVVYKASGKLAKALATNAEYVKSETLATELKTASAPKGDRVESFEFDGETLTVSVRRV